MLVEMIEELGHRVVAEAGAIGVTQGLPESAIFDLAILDVNVGGRDIDPVATIINRRNSAIRLRDGPCGLKSAIRFQ
jgi:hypothetical protein